MTIQIILLFFAGTFATFTEYPSNISSLIGGSVTIRCASRESAEPILYSQWKSNTGSLLGYHQDGVLPGHQNRYSYIKPNPGELHLKINHVNLEDDGEYECQMLHPENGPIRAKSFLNVIVLPQSIHFTKYQQGSVISVQEETTLNLTCVVPNVKPEPELLWYVDDELITKNIMQTKVQHVNRTSTIFTSLLMSVHRADHGKIVKCEVIQKEHNIKLSSNTTLDVLYRSSEPQLSIEGGSSIARVGENVSLLCLVKDGNPMPDVSWYSNNNKLSSHGILKSDTKEIRTIHSFIASKTDNGAKFECRANNSHSEYMKKYLTLEVHYPATDVELFGNSYIRYGSSSQFQCKSQVSNPASEIYWFLNGKPMHTSTEKEIANSNGYISYSNLTLYPSEITSNMNSFTVECSAKNAEGSASKQHTVKLISPPSAPEIHGLDKNYYFDGEIVNLTCIAHGGNPLAELTWFRANEKINSVQNKAHGTSSMSLLTIRLDRTDNNHRIKCEAFNAALDDPLIESRHVVVTYPPRSLVIKPASQPFQFIAGKPARLVCESVASYPAAQLSWKLSSSNEKLLHGDTSLNETLENNDFNVNNVLSFVPSEENHGSLVHCVASNPDWKYSVNTTFLLNVFYPPKLLINDPVTITVSENDSFRENLTVKSNPPVASWRWRKDGLSFDHATGNVFARGAAFFGRQVKNSDAGIYTVTAANSLGSTNLTIKLVVEYNAKITKISTPVVAALDDTVFLECEAIGEPFKVTMIKWYRNGNLLTSTYRNNNTAVVRLNATKTTSGEYICVVDNNVGLATEKNTFLLVNSAPEIIIDSRYAKSAGMLGEDAMLKCKAYAVPFAEFFWRVNKQLIKSNSSKYSFKTEQIDYSTFESKLWIKDLVPDDYTNQMECISKNSFGSDSLTIAVIPATYPDLPLNFSLSNLTKDTISLSWVPQFDGGSEQIFEIKYKSEDQDNYYSVNTSYSSLRLSGLSTAQTYSFEIRSINAKGFASSWSKPFLFSTLGENGVTIKNSRNTNDWLTNVVTIVIIAVVIFFLVHALICCFLCNRKKRKLREKTEKVRLASGEVRRVQMYGALSANDKISQSNFGEMPEMSEDEHSVKTMIEVSPNGYMQPLDHLVYEDSNLLDYNFQTQSYRGKNYSPNHSTYANISYQEPPQQRFLQLTTQRSYNNTNAQNNFSTFISPRTGVNTGPIDFCQLDGDLV